MLTFSQARTAMVAGVALLAVTACGGSDESGTRSELASIELSPEVGSGGEPPPADPTEDSSDTSPDEPVDPDEAFARFEACMADQGVEISTVGVGGGAAVPADDVVETPESGPSFEDMEAAQRECEPILDEAFGDFELSPEQEAEQADQMLALQRCLANEGFEIDLQGNSFIQEQTGDDDGFDAAFNECIDDAGLGQPVELDS